jgi:NADH-quinone oxidoreductase subunit L
MDYQLLGPACLLAPLAAFFIALVLFRKNHMAAMATVLGAGVISVASALLLLAQSSGEAVVYSQPWISAGGIDIHFGLLLDGTTLIMGVIVAVITLCIQIYSLNYMGHDPGRGRFFAFLALFEWAMLSFVYSPSLMQTFVFWELVGLASFFLIGFWYQKPSAVAAAKKAFIMTRIGDVGLFIGLILLFQSAQTLDILSLNSQTFESARIELITLLIFVGIVGKSAQFPLHTWLPDAMEGPTPVSALLHSATMVAAGVFLFARFHPLFMQAELTLDIALGIAAFTAVLSATMALVAKDMKRVLAYSSISQLGFMLMGLAAGNLFAGYFHLTTHAIFKALLFLCAGSYIHHYETNDMIAIGRAGGRKLRFTTVGLIAGGAALAGIAPFAGFWSKDLILHSLSGPVLIAAYLASFLTAYYTFRMIFLVVMPNDDSQAVVEQEAHEYHDVSDRQHSEIPTLAPIVFLTAGAVVAGFLGGAIADILGVERQAVHLGDAVIPIGVALAGVLLAWLDFGRGGARQVGFISVAKPLQTLFENGWYLDLVYKKVFVRLAQEVAGLLFGVENKGFDGTSDGIGKSTLRAGGVASHGQRGHLQFYIGVAILGVVAACLAIAVGAAS